MVIRYLLLFGKLTAKKPPMYCELHKCGLTKHRSKPKCSKCRHCLPMTDARARDIIVNPPGRGR